MKAAPLPPSTFRHPVASSLEDWRPCYEIVDFRSKERVEVGFVSLDGNIVAVDREGVGHATVSRSTGEWRFIRGGSLCAIPLDAEH